MKRLCRALPLVMVAMLLLTSAVFAAYYVYIITENTGSDYTKLALNMTLDVDALVDGGFISATGLDTRVTGSEYVVLPHLLANDKILWVSDLKGNSDTQFIFWTEQDFADSFSVIAGHNGYVTINDTADLEPGDAYAFGVVAYVNTDAGANKSIIRKDGACVLNVSAEDTLTFWVTGGNSLTATNVTSGFMTIMVYCDTFDMWMTIGDVEKDSDTASSIPDTASNWTLFENNVCPYVYYYGEWVV